MPTALSVDRVQGLSGSLALKAPVKCASTENLVLNGLQTVDGVILAEGDRVLVKDQTSGVANGIYTASTSDWSRAYDFNGPNDAVQGTQISVYSGTTNGQSWWRLTTDNPVIGTSSLVFTLNSSSGMVVESDVPAIPSPSSGDGSGWVLFTDGVTSWWVLASTLADTALPTFDSHSFTAVGDETTTTLPFAYTVGGKSLWVFDNGIRQTAGVQYTESSETEITWIETPIAGHKFVIIANISATQYVPTDATLAALFELTPAANKIAYFTNGTTAALTDFTALARTLAAAATAAEFRTAIGAASATTASGFGVGQTWQDVKASRAPNVSYPNSTGAPIMVNIQHVNDPATVQISINNSTWVTVASSSDADYKGPMSAVVPNGHYYKLVASSGTVNYWAELR